MVRHSNTWVFNITPENWNSCASGPTGDRGHPEEYVGLPWHGSRTSSEPDLEPGDLVLARRTSGRNPYGVLGLWEFLEAAPVHSQEEIPWEDAEYDWVVYCEPIEREFEEVYTEDFSERVFSTGHLQGAIKSLKPEHKEDYLQALSSHDSLTEDARSRITAELAGDSVETRSTSSGENGDNPDSITDTESSELYVAPLDDTERRAYTQIVETALDPNRVDAVPPVLRSERSLRFWAFDTEAAPVQSPPEGASIVFVHQGDLVGQHVVKDVAESEEVGNWFWQDSNRRLVVTLRDGETATLSDGDLRDILDSATFETSSALVAVDSQEEN